jgi:hypothetical protein
MDPRDEYPIDSRGWCETRTAAEHALTTTGNLAILRVKGGGPRYKKAGAKVLYSFAEIDRWLLARPTMAHTSGERQGFGGPRKLAAGAVR